MLRFIFVCMGIVALSMLSIGMQFMTDGISETQTQIAERNEPVENMVAAVDTSTDMYQEFSPEQLNQIETTAGDTIDTGFGADFTNLAPKALQETPEVAALPTDNLSVSVDTTN